MTQIPLKLIQTDRGERSFLAVFPERKLIEYLVLPISIEQSLPENFTEVKSPFIYTERDVYCFFVVPFTSKRDEKPTSQKIIAIGPCFFYQQGQIPVTANMCSKNIAAGCFRNFSEQMLNDILAFVPCLPFQYVIDTIKVLFRMIFDTPISTFQILERNCTDNLFNSVPKMAGEEIFERREGIHFHIPWLEEKKLWEAIRNGNINRVADIYNRFNPEGYGIIAKTTIRQEKNIFIASVTLATRAALDGGVPDETAYAMSDSFIMNVENLATADKIINFTMQMLKSFATAVTQFRTKKDYTPDIYGCLSYIDRNLQQKITLEDLSEIIHLSPSQISRRFKKQTGKSLVEYIQWQRILAAKNMLEYSAKSILEISNNFNFSSQSYFIRIFKKFTGMSPTEYRKSLQ